VTTPFTPSSFTGWLLVLFPATSLTQGLYWQCAFALALWVTVAVILRSLQRAPAPRRRTASRAVGADARVKAMEDV